MSKYVFVEVENVLRTIDGAPIRDMIELMNILAEYYSVFVLSAAIEPNRLELETWLVDNEVNIEQVFLREPGDYTKAHDLRIAFVLDHFCGNTDKALENTFAVFMNNERCVEELREIGFRCIISDWG